MSTRLKRRLGLLGLSILTVLLGPSLPACAGDAAHLPLAVLFFADWCANCKALEPKYEPAKAGLEDKIRFVVLDVTNEATKTKAKALAYSLGIAPLYFANHATGWVALLDAQGRQVGTLHDSDSEDDMHASLAHLARLS